MLFMLLAGCTNDIFEDLDIENDNTVAILEADGKTLTYGDNYYVLNETEDITTVTFTHFPATRREFESLQEKLLGKSRPGTLALELMAFEMYRRNRVKGEKCIKLCTLSAQATMAISQLSQKFPEHRGDALTDGYMQPYLIASFLVGATEANGYQPDYPYVFSFKYSDSPYDKQAEYSRTYWGTIYYYYTNRNGKTDKSTDASVIVPDDGTYVMVRNCPNYYYSAVPIRTWEDTLK